MSVRDKTGAAAGRAKGRWEVKKKKGGGQRGRWSSTTTTTSQSVSSCCGRLVLQHGSQNRQVAAARFRTAGRKSSRREIYIVLNGLLMTRWCLHAVVMITVPTAGAVNQRREGDSFKMDLLSKLNLLPLCHRAVATHCVSLFRAWLFLEEGPGKGRGALQS